MPATYNGRPLLDPLALFQECQRHGLPTDRFWGRANSFRFQGGEQPGRGWLLMLRSDVVELKEQAERGDAEWGTPFELVLDDGQGGRLELQNILFIRAECLTPGADEDPNAAYLVEVADTRWFECNPFHRRAVIGTALVRDYSTNQLEGGSTHHGTNLGTTWAEVVYSLLNMYSLWDVPTTLPFEPDGTPEGYEFRGEPRWKAGNEVLARLGLTVVPDLLSKAPALPLRLYRLGAESSAFAAAEKKYRNRRVFDADIIENRKVKLPGSVGVLAHRHDLHHGAQKAGWARSVVWPTRELDRDGNSVNVAPTPRDSGFHHLFDELPIITRSPEGFNDNVAAPLGEENRENHDALVTRAAERVSDYYRLVGMRPLHRIYTGIINDAGFFPNEQVTGVAWYDQGQGYLTEVVRSHSPLRVDDSGDWVEYSCLEHLRPPDLSRRSFPVWPPVGQEIYVAGSLSEENGVSQAWYYWGMISPWAEGQPAVTTAQAECFIVSLAVYNDVSVRLDTPSNHVGRQYGLATLAIDRDGNTRTLPLFITDACCPTSPAPSGGGGEWTELMAQAIRQTPPHVLAIQEVPVGVVVGSYGWPSLVELQLATIRETCGGVPVLVSNDRPEAHDDLRKICARYDADLDTNRERLGHTAGDVRCAWKAVTWGRLKGLRLVAKLSQRCLVTKPGWLREEARALLASGLPLSCRKCVGRERFALRTEAYLIDLDAWDRPEILARLNEKDYPAPLNAESVLSRLLEDHLGGVFWPWSLMGPQRYKRQEGVVWHCANPREDYEALAQKYGVTLDRTLHTDGWQRDRNYKR